MLGGQIGSGKNTAADYLSSQYGYKQVALSGVLKDIIADRYGFDRVRLNGLTAEDREWREQQQDKLIQHCPADTMLLGSVPGRMGYSPVLRMLFTPPYVKEMEHPLDFDVMSDRWNEVSYLELGMKTMNQVHEQLHSLSQKLKSCHTIRELMQIIGTDIFRTIYEDCWCQKLDWLTQSGLEVGERYVVTDGRFGNEAKWCKAKDGIVIYLRRGQQLTHAEHASEDLADYERESHWIVSNNDAIRELYGKLDEILRIETI